jgi:hypothetical protein
VAADTVMTRERPKSVTFRGLWTSTVTWAWQPNQTTHQTTPLHGPEAPVKLQMESKGTPSLANQTTVTVNLKTIHLPKTYSCPCRAQGTMETRPIRIQKLSVRLHGLETAFHGGAWRSSPSSAS